MSAAPATFSFLSPLAIFLSHSLSSLFLAVHCKPTKTSSLASPLREPRSKKEGVVWGIGVGKPTNRFSNSGVVLAGREGIRGAVAPIRGADCRDRRRPFWCFSPIGGKGQRVATCGHCSLRYEVGNSTTSAGRRDGSAPPPLPSILI